MLNKTQRRIRWVTAALVGLAIVSATAMTALAQTPEASGPPAAQIGPRGRGPGGVGGPGRGFGPEIRGRGPGRLRPGAGRMGLGPGLGDVAAALRDQIRGITEKHQPQIQPLVEQLRTARAALDQVVTATPVNEATIRQRSGEVAAIEANLAVARARLNADVLAALTPEQRELVQQRRSRSREERRDGPRRRVR